MDGKKILSILTTRLKENDQLLSDMEKLAVGVKASDDDAMIMKRTSELSRVLAQYIAEEIYCRLDRLYLEKILDGSKTVSDAPTKKESEAVTGLEEEMDSLYPEINILAEISTKQQFVEPILRELQNHNGQLRIASHQKLDHVGLLPSNSPYHLLTVSLSDSWNHHGYDDIFRKPYYELARSRVVLCDP
jgi:hypothetical protein